MFFKSMIFNIYCVKIKVPKNLKITIFTYTAILVQNETNHGRDINSNQMYFLFKNCFILFKN